MQRGARGQLVLMGFADASGVKLIGAEAAAALPSQQNCTQHKEGMCSGAKDQASWSQGQEAACRGQAWNVLGTAL